MAKFEEYTDKFQNIRMERHNGVLQVIFHTNGDRSFMARSPAGERPRITPDDGCKWKTDM